MTVSLNVNLSDEAAVVLKSIADKRGIGATEALTRAIAWYQFFEDELGSGKQIRLVDPDTGNEKEIRPLY